MGSVLGIPRVCYCDILGYHDNMFEDFERMCFLGKIHG